MSGQQGGGGGNDNLIIGGIALIVALSFLFMITGWVSSLIYTAGSKVPSAGFGDMPRILVGIVTNAGQPNMAWPQADQAIVPGAVLFWGTFILLIVLFAAVGWFGYNFYQERFAGGRNGKLGQKSTQWARKADIKKLVVRDTTPGRLTLGRVGNALIATEVRHSVIVMGPTQSGKTTGLAVPAILEWEGPVIATSVKNDLAEDTMAWRSRKGNVWVYDPTKATGMETSTWSPLDGAREWSGAKRIAASLTSAAKSGSKGMSDNAFWYNLAGMLLAPHLYAAANSGQTMEDVVGWISSSEEWEVRAALGAIPGPDSEAAMKQATASWDRDERTRSSVYTTAQEVIEAYSDPSVIESARTSEITSEKFLDGGQHTLYVCAPSHEQERLRPVFTTLLRQFIRAAYEFAPTLPDRRLDPSMLIVLDEAANIAPLDDLDAIASTCSGLGIQLVTVWQDMAQINNRYGDRAQTVVNNHRAKIVLSGISDTGTLDYFSRLIGSEEVRSESTTRDAQGSKSTTISVADKNLAPADVVRRIKMNEGVLIYGSFLPARLYLRPWYKDKRLSAMRNNDIAAYRRAGPTAKPKQSSGSVADRLMKKLTVWAEALQKKANQSSAASGKPRRNGPSSRPRPNDPRRPQSRGGYPPRRSNYPQRPPANSGQRPRPRYDANGANGSGNGDGARGGAPGGGPRRPRRAG